MIEKKTVVQGGHGPVPMEENSRRYIDAEPVEVPMTAYYVRRMLAGELVEVDQPKMAEEPMTMRAKAEKPATLKAHDKDEGK